MVSLKDASAFSRYYVVECGWSIWAGVWFAVLRSPGMNVIGHSSTLILISIVGTIPLVRYLWTEEYLSDSLQLAIYSVYLCIHSFIYVFIGFLKVFIKTSLAQLWMNVHPASGGTCVRVCMCARSGAVWNGSGVNGSCFQGAQVLCSMATAPECNVSAVPSPTASWKCILADSAIIRGAE